MLVHPKDGTPQPGFAKVRAEALARDETPAEHELKQEQAEIASAPFKNLNHVRVDLRQRRDQLQAAAAAHELAVAACATSPMQVSSTVTPDARYQQMEGRFGLLGRQQLTCGMHVHVSIESPDEGVAIIDRIRPWLPALIAMSANSPYWQGTETGYASFRTVIWGQWPTAGPTELFGGLSEYNALVADLLTSGTILDEGMVYFDARLSRKYPTVEIRVADVCTDVNDGVAIGAICRALVDTVAQQALNGYAAPAIRSELLRVASWGAARYGLTDTLFDSVDRRPVPAADLLDRLLDLVHDALVHNGDLAMVEHAVSRMLTRGTGADRQRRMFTANGDLTDVVLDVVGRT
ncbi:MAG: YbdK family carboxylate-amine ligase [Frankiales bacterium]|nr:YbdK family carboxylate-amine ligase [Frankiales bacterium]